MSSDRLKAFPRIDPATLPLVPWSRARPIDKVMPWFDGDGLVDKLARALLVAQAVPFKELLESFEVFAHVRKRVRAPVVVDLCCGHGLVGVLYGVLQRDVDRVLLVDRQRPESVDRVLAALAPVAPWLAPKVAFVEAGLDTVDVPAGAAVLGIHACGGATDAVIDRALAARGPVALVPCCHQKSQLPGPPTLGRALGLDLATDVHRTYRLHAAGYQTRWSELPAVITPKNRVIAAWPAAGSRP